MDIKTQLKNLLREAEIYQRQGLLNDAKAHYKKATDIIRSNPQIPNGQTLINSIVKRVVNLNQEIDKLNEVIKRNNPSVSDQKQDLIKKLFVAPGAKGNKNSRLDGAITLAKFGQYERALKEFEPLLKEPSLRVTAAKNIMRCLLELNDEKRALAAFSKWQKDDKFTRVQLEKIRFFSNQRLSKAGLKPLPKSGQSASKPVSKNAISKPAPAPGRRPMAKSPSAPPPAIDPSEFASDDDVLDISSIGIRFDSGPLDGNSYELDVSFQSGNSLNLIIPQQEKGLIDHIEVGTKLENIQFFSPIAILNGSGVVTAKNRIQSGPKEGNYSLDIAILK